MRRGVGRASTSSEVSRNLRRANRRGLNGARKGNPGVLVSTPELTRLDQGNDQIDHDTSETRSFGFSSGYLMSCFGMLDSVHIGSPLFSKGKNASEAMHYRHAIPFVYRAGARFSITECPFCG